MKTRDLFCAAFAAALLAGCGGGSGGTAAPAPIPTTVSTQQVVSAQFPGEGLGVETDPIYGAVTGFTQQSTSQVLGFAPGSQIMVRNLDSGIPHTLSVVSTTGFTANPTLSTTAAGDTTIGAGFSSGAVTAGTLAGPFTLATGVYYLGCAYHYVSNGMRTVMVVATGATPGPQATPDAGATQPPVGGTYVKTF